MKSNWPLIFLFFPMLHACKTPVPVRPQEYYETISIVPEPSTINIPIRIYKSELESAINAQLGQVLYEDKNLADDGYMMKATKRENISIDFDNEYITYRLPIHLWIKRSLTVTNVEADGALALTFKTKYAVKPDWTFETKTELSSYRWIQEPVLRLGFANLPVTTIANMLLNKTKADIASEIDTQVKEVFSLKAEMEKAWKSLHEPFEMSEEYAAWLLLKPLSISMAPMQTKGNRVESTIVVVSQPEAILGGKPAASPVKPLPMFQYSLDTSQTFSIYLNTEVPIKEAERITKQNMIGYEYTYGNKKIKIEDIELWGQGDKLVINTKLSGSYNGNIYFTGKPVYSSEKNKIEIADMEFDFETKRALLRTASWLFKGTLEKMVQENTDFYLNYNIEDTKKMIQEQLKNYEVAPGILLDGTLDEINISHVYIQYDAIKVRIGVKGLVNLDIKGLGF
jgi:hypothetical protein